MTADSPEQSQEEALPEEALEGGAAAPTPIMDGGREAELEAELARLKDQLLRAMAETENVRRRLEAAAKDAGRYAVSNFAKDMLQVADNLRRALEAAPSDKLESDNLAKSLAEGVELTERGLLATLDRHGIKKIEAKGQRFDANFHQAMMEVDDASAAPGTVVMEIQTGYTLNDRLLRPSLVGVAKSRPGDAGLDTKA